ncbi:MAG TPA: hypothetical protein VKV22_12625 [Rhodanobacteraceae bacterium]|nr:hypothetical protein [Rhodanobacteraceae bacterium]
MPGPATLFCGMLFGAIGVGYFVYGKRQAAIMPLVCGIALVAYPWFVASVPWLIVIGLILMAVPFFVRY